MDTVAFVSEGKKWDVYWKTEVCSTLYLSLYHLVHLYFINAVLNELKLFIDYQVI